MANRLTNVGGQAYTWDNNGNLLADGTHIYPYSNGQRIAQATVGCTQYFLDCEIKRRLSRCS